jgi:probable O-glycosylation ligase (exosortase A-associated)
MRDIVLTIVVFGILPFVFKRPYIGIYLWTWLGLMNPHRLTWGFAFNFPFAQIVAITILISVLVSKEPKQIPWTRETILLLAFILWMLCTTFFAFYPYLAWHQWDKVWKIMLMIYVTMMLINSKQQLDWLVWVVVLSLGFYGVKGGIFTILHGGAFRVQGPMGSFITGNNETALALIMIVPLMRYLQMQAKIAWIRHGLTVSMLLTGIAIIGSQSRGALIGSVVMGSFLWLKSRNKIFIFVSLLVIVVSVAAIMPQQWRDRMMTIETYQKDSSAMSRIYSWRMAYNLAKHRITGGGFDTFHEAVFQLYAPSDYTRTSDAHSIYFEVMGEHGFVGFTMFMLLGWFTWNTGSRIREQGKYSMETKWATDLAGMTQVSIIGYASAGAFLGLAYFDLYYDMIAIMVLCSIILKKQNFQMQAAMVNPKHKVSFASEYHVSEIRLLNGRY